MKSKNSQGSKRLYWGCLFVIVAGILTLFYVTSHTNSKYVNFKGPKKILSDQTFLYQNSSKKSQYDREAYEQEVCDLCLNDSLGSLSNDSIKIFIYELDRYGIQPDIEEFLSPEFCNTTSEFSSQSSKTLCNYGYLESFSVYQNDEKRSKYKKLPHFHNTDVYGMSAIVHYRLMNSRYRTLDPNEANLFYIPYYSASFNMQEIRQHQSIEHPFNNSDQTMWELITSQYPYWKKHQGKDHFMILDRQLVFFEFWNKKPPFSKVNPLTNDWTHLLNLSMVVFEDSMHSPRAEWAGSEEKLEAFDDNRIYAIYPSLVHFSPVQQYPQLADDYFKFMKDRWRDLQHCNKFGAKSKSKSKSKSNHTCTQLDTCKGIESFKKWVQMMYKGDIDTKSQEKFDLYAHKRDYLSSYIGGIRTGDESDDKYVTKKACYYQCLEAGDCYTHENAMFMPDKQWAAINGAGAYLNSVFCLQPPGDMYSRKGLTDGALMGCIPVYFDQRSVIIPSYIKESELDKYFYYIDHKKVVSNETSIMAELRKVPQQQIKSMQKNIQALQKRFQYSMMDSCDNSLDALETIIRDIFKRAQEQAYGKSAQEFKVLE